MTINSKFTEAAASSRERKSKTSGESSNQGIAPALEFSENVFDSARIVKASSVHGCRNTVESVNDFSKLIKGGSGGHKWNKMVCVVAFWGGQVWNFIFKRARRNRQTDPLLAGVVD